MEKEGRTWKLRLLAVGLVVMLLGRLFIGLFPAVGENQAKPNLARSSKNSLTPHAPIYIEGNANFIAENCVTSGSGTASDPYIIKDWNIKMHVGTEVRGIYIVNTNVYFIIRNCVIYYEDTAWPYTPLYGIFLSNVTNGKIENCNIYNNTYGTYLDYSLNNTVSANYIYNNPGHGVVLSSSSNNNIRANYVYNNSGRGIVLSSSSNNNIRANYVYNNSQYGIYLSSSSNNSIYHNNFINNINQTYDESFNIWDNGYPSGGNYWSDYTCSDLYSGANQDRPGSDGIGDTPYNISGGTNKDRYPLMRPWNITIPEPPRVLVTHPNSGETFVVGSNINITWTATQGTYSISYTTVYYSYDDPEGDGPWVMVANLSVGAGHQSYLWTVNNTPSMHCWVKVEAVDTNGTLGWDTSNATFTITIYYTRQADLMIDGDVNNVYYTNEAAAAATVQNKTKSALPGASITFSIKIENDGNTAEKLRYVISFTPYPTAGWSVTPAAGTYYTATLAAGASETFTLTISIPAAAVEGEKAKVVIRANSTGDIGNDTVIAWANVLVGMSVIVNSPNGGESWEGNANYWINYTIAGGTPPYTVKLYYSTNGGSTWTFIGYDNRTTAGTFSYAWPTPTVNSTNCYVNVSVFDSLFNAGYDLSDVRFTIRYTSPNQPPSVNITYPTNNQTVNGTITIRGSAYDPDETTGLTPHAPIYIEGNANFTWANGVRSGNGTQSNPYIIENWDINASGASEDLRAGGIHIGNTSVYFIIRNCIVHNSNQYGIYFCNITHGAINNTTLYNNGVGIMLYYSSTDDISLCNIYSNYYGIELSHSSNNTISTCHIHNNYLGFLLLFSNGNSIYHNNFLNNTNSAYDYYLNIWDNGYPSGGNYWSDYTGVDNYSGPNQDQPSRDGIGDTPYNIRGGNNRDRYPLMNPVNITVSRCIQTNERIGSNANFQKNLNGTTVQFVEIKIDKGAWQLATGTTSWSFVWDTTTVPNDWHTIYARAYDGIDYSAIKSVNVYVYNILNLPPIANFSYSPVNPTTNDIIQFNDASIDTDGYIVTWYWDFGDGNNSTSQNPTHQYTVAGNYNVTLTVQDNKSAMTSFSCIIAVRPSHPIVLLLQPNGGETLSSGSIYKIKWLAIPGSYPIEQIYIHYTYDSGTTWYELASSIQPNLTSWDWVVNNTPSPNCLVKVTAVDTNGSEGSDVSNDTFAIFGIRTMSAPVGTYNLSIVYRSAYNITVESAQSPGDIPVELKDIGLFVNITGIATDTYITIPYKDENIAGINETTLKLYYWNETTNTWELVPETGVWTNNNTIWARVEHFTIFAPLGEKLSAQPVLQVPPPGRPYELIYTTLLSACILIIVVSIAVAIRKRKKYKGE
ncbi:MAG: NosD domain-containing protein [Candidatus Thermoplasmatota archaeon]